MRGLPHASRVQPLVMTVSERRRETIVFTRSRFQAAITPPITRRPARRQMMTSCVSAVRCIPWLGVPHGFRNSTVRNIFLAISRSAGRALSACIHNLTCPCGHSPTYKSV